MSNLLDFLFSNLNDRRRRYLLPGMIILTKDFTIALLRKSVNEAKEHKRRLVVSRIRYLF